VISNNSGAKALERARNENIPAIHISEKSANSTGGNLPPVDELIFKTLVNHKTDIVFLAGYLKKIPVNVLSAYKSRIFNIHPALLPKHGGKGMFGLNVHAAVLDAGDTETGITIHRVTAEYDAGDILAQKKVPVREGDTPEILAARVLEQEHIFIVEFLSSIL
jgi:phosphoribosylglycinamide formyltransferase-1